MSRGVLKKTCLGAVVMASRIDTEILLGTFNSVMPNLMNEG